MEVTAKFDDARNSSVEAGRIIGKGAPKVERIFTLRGMLILACVWIISLLYMGHYLKRGWVPHDEGTFAQSAERVLQGELPHRDFIDNYTGGLTFLNALAFRLLGVNLATLRIVLFAFFALWVPCVFYVASRFVSPFTAGAITLSAIAWSLPNYPAGVPSWYNLFFAVFGIAALFKYMEAGASRWLFLAGLCAGLSLLIKITGLYFVTTAILFFIFREQNLTSLEKIKSSKPPWIYRGVLAIGLTLFLTSLTRLVTRIDGVRGLIYFAMPSALLVILLLYREGKKSPGENWNRFRTLFAMAAPFAIGTALPILVFLIPFQVSHSTGTLLHDLFDGTERQLRFAATAPPLLLMMIPVLSMGILIVMVLSSHREGQLVYGSILAVYLCIILLFSPEKYLIYALGWCSMAFSVPLITLAGVIAIGNSKLGLGLSHLRQERTMLLLAAMALISVVQFPFSAPVYFCYVAPLVILAVVALLASVESAPRLAYGALVVFYLSFPILSVTPGFSLGAVRHAQHIETKRLTLARAGSLRVDPDDARVYEALVPAIKSRATSNYMYAAPDCPEVYFLAGLKNPTPTIFDFRDDSIGRNERILGSLRSHDVNVVVVNRGPQFSKELEPDLLAALEIDYPNSEEVGRFVLRWKSELVHHDGTQRPN